MKYFGIIQGRECFETKNYVLRIDTDSINNKNNFFSVQWISKCEGKVRIVHIGFTLDKRGQLHLHNENESLIEAIKLCLSELKGSWGESHSITTAS